MLIYSKISLSDLKNLEGESEKYVFNNLGLAWIPPERREAQIAFIGLKRKYPRLIELKNLKGAFHNHTIASDGNNTLLQMQQAAYDQGLSYISINDHSPKCLLCRRSKQRNFIELTYSS